MLSRHELGEHSGPPITAVDWEVFDQERAALAATAHANDFYARIASSERIGVTELVPHLTIILPDVGMPLAKRPDNEDFGVEQVLYGIVRAGNHGFGLATAYSTARLRHTKIKHKGRHRANPGLSYLTKINMDPHGEVPETKFVTPLWPDAPGISLGGPSTLVPELSNEGLNLIINATDAGEIRLQLLGKRLGKLPFQLITAIGPKLFRSGDNCNPVDEVGTWAPYPPFVKRKLRIR